MNLVEDIKKFHELFELQYNKGPRELETKYYDFRIKFMAEELGEYIQAVKDRNLEGQLDALVDLCYVTIGTAYLQGFDFNEAWRRVHAANMQKIKIENKEVATSKRQSKYDVVKPPNWKAPDLSDLVVKQLNLFEEV